MMSNLRIVTTSWDDGHPFSLKMADLLRSRNINGTFYVPITNCEDRETVGPEELKSLAFQGFEIGAHGFTHDSLPKFDGEALDHEVADCKQALEDILGAEVRMFCYPLGRYNADVISRVRAAGYQGARTTRMLGTDLNFALFEMPVTLQAYPHRKSTYLKNLAKARNMPGFYDYMTRLSAAQGWVELGKKLFDRVLLRGGIWHLFGHSWEIDQLGMWPDLEQMLDYVRGRTGVLYLSNSDTLKFLRARPEGLPQQAQLRI